MKLVTSIIFTLFALSVIIVEAHDDRSREHLEEKEERTRTKVGSASEHHHHHHHHSDNKPRIVGGDQSALNDFPYYGKSFCSIGI